MFFPLFNLFRGYEIGHVFQHPGRLGCFTTRLRAAEPIGGIATLRLGAQEIPSRRAGLAVHHGAEKMTPWDPTTMSFYDVRI